MKPLFSTFLHFSPTPEWDIPGPSCDEKTQAVMKPFFSTFLTFLQNQNERFQAQTVMKKRKAWWNHFSQFFFTFLQNQNERFRPQTIMKKRNPWWNNFSPLFSKTRTRHSGPKPWWKNASHHETTFLHFSLFFSKIVKHFVCYRLVFTKTQKSSKKNQNS